MAKYIKKDGAFTGDDSTLDRVKVSPQYSYSNITTQTTTVVKSGAGVLSKITVNAAAANGVITIYDNTAASGTVIATITCPATLLQNHYVLEFDVVFATGLTIVTGTANQNITVSYL